MATLSLTLSSCDMMYWGHYDYDLRKLEHRELNFNELPNEVREYIHHKKEKACIIDDIQFVTPNDTMRYHEERISDILLPWVVKFSVLKDNHLKKDYKVDKRLVTPFMIYQNKVYVPDIPVGDYDQKEYEYIKYTVYDLKEE